MRSLKELATRAVVDNRRHDVLRRTLQTVGEHDEADKIKIEMTLSRNVDAYEVADEVVATIKRLWPMIRDETMLAAKAELDEIESRYAPLLQDRNADEAGCA